ncbi:MAG: transposase, partial [Magnetococcus sp. DMHC-8]
MIRERDKKQPTLPGFESSFERSLSPNNRWIKLAEVVPWDEFATAYYSGMCADQGAPAKPARLIVGAVIIKHRQRWTDEETVLQIQENPYLQFFYGFSGFTLEQPFAPSLFVEIRKRMGAAVYEQFEQSVATKLSDILKKREKKAKPPTQQDGGMSAPAPLGGIRPDLNHEWPVGLSHRHLRQLWVIREVYNQQKHMYDNRLRSHPHRIVSISQPHVRPIIRGKAGTSVEFGAKLSASLDDNGLARVDELRWEAFNESADLTGQ